MHVFYFVFFSDIELTTIKMGSLYIFFLRDKLPLFLFLNFLFTFTGMKSIPVNVCMFTRIFVLYRWYCFYFLFWILFDILFSFNIQTHLHTPTYLHPFLFYLWKIPKSLFQLFFLLFGPMCVTFSFIFIHQQYIYTCMMIASVALLLRNIRSFVSPKMWRSFCRSFSFLPKKISYSCPCYTRVYVYVYVCKSACGNVKNTYVPCCFYSVYLLFFLKGFLFFLRNIFLLYSIECYDFFFFWHENCNNNRHFFWEALLAFYITAIGVFVQMVTNFVFVVDWKKENLVIDFIVEVFAFCYGYFENLAHFEVLQFFLIFCGNKTKRMKFCGNIL